MPKNSSFAVVAVFLIIINANIFINNANASLLDNYDKNQVKIANKNATAPLEKLNMIDKYQEKYFTIVKRNNMFVNTVDFEDIDKIDNDRKELKKLFTEVKKQIKNKKYLKEYKAIEKRYSKCNEETTIGMNEFAKKNYDEIDSLLNEVYKEVKSKISPEDFKELTASEKKWLEEVKGYKKVYDSMGFGTIGTIIYYDYEINMREFRTLLLMLYL